MAEIKKIELRPAFVYLHDIGRSVSDIAKFFNVTRTFISTAVQRYRTSGSNKNKRGSGRRRTARSEDNVLAAGLELALNPSTKVNSTRKLANSLNISRTSIRRILKTDLSLHPYKMICRQALTENNVANRIFCCIDFQARFANGMHRSIIFSDEKIFNIEQAFNHQNDRLWMRNRPSNEERVIERVQHPQQVFPLAIKL